MNKGKFVLNILGLFVLVIAVILLCVLLRHETGKIITAVYDGELGPIIRLEVTSTNGSVQTIYPDDSRFERLKGEINNYYYKKPKAMEDKDQEEKAKELLKKELEKDKKKKKK